MKKFKVIFKQMFKVLTLNNSYPCVECFKYSNWEWDKNGNVSYNQFKTLVNYLADTKTQ